MRYPRGLIRQVEARVDPPDDGFDVPSRNIAYPVTMIVRGKRVTVFVYD